MRERRRRLQKFFPAMSVLTGAAILLLGVLFLYNSAPFSPDGGDGEPPVEKDEVDRGTDRAEKQAASQMRRNVERFGITWTFDREYAVGTFANGDHWVVGPVTIVEIDPTSTDTDGRIRNGSMLNPTHKDTPGYDSAPRAGGFSAENNVGRPNGEEISSSNPLVIEPDASLVSTRTHEEPEMRPHVVDAAILTVLDKPPPGGSFRPPYSGEDKLLEWTASDIRWQRLPRFPQIPDSAPSPDTMERWIERPWIDHGGGVWTGREIHPSGNMPDYGRDMAHRTSQVALALLLDYSQEEIEPLMISFLQLGLDWYGVTHTSPERFNSTSQGHLWHGGGGHGHGRKWPMLFAGLMFDDQDILEYTDAGGYRHRWDNPDWEDEPGYPIFQEEQQTFIITRHDVDQERFADDGRRRDPYSEDMIGLPEWGEQHMNNPVRDGSNWGASYRSIVSNSIAGHVLAARLMDAKEEWGWDPIFDYLDRWVGADAEHGSWSDDGSNAPRPFVRDMWELYR